MIEYEAGEFISMLILNEKLNGKNKFKMSMGKIYELAREIQLNNFGIRINLSTDSLQSYFVKLPTCHCQKNDGLEISRPIYVKNNNVCVDKIDDDTVYSFLRRYANENTLAKIQSNK